MIKRSTTHYAVINAIENLMNNGSSVYFVTKDSTGIHLGQFSPYDDSTEMRNRLLSFPSIEIIDIEEEGALIDGWNDIDVDDTCDFYELSKTESTGGCERMQIMIDPDMYADSYDLQNMIVNKHSDLEAIEITEGSNGYPRNVRGAVIGCNYDKAEEIASMYGCSVVSVCRRDGWRLFECEGNAYSDYDMTDVYNNDSNFVFDNAKQFVGFINDYIKDYEESEDYDKVEELSKLKDRVLQEDLKDEVFVVENGDVRYYELVSRTACCYSYDVWTHCIAIDCMTND